MRQIIEHFPSIELSTFPVGSYCYVYFFHSLEIISEDTTKQFTNQDFEYVFTDMLFHCWVNWF